MLRKPKTVAVISVIAGVVLAGWAGQTLIRARSQTARNACLKNLRAIEAASAKLAQEQAAAATNFFAPNKVPGIP
jgi:hypothetical protein